MFQWHINQSSEKDVARYQIVSIQSAPVSQTACCKQRDAEISEATERPIVVAMADACICI
jgi:hypothetical protein